jgi:hypothetical protein
VCCDRAFAEDVTSIRLVAILGGGAVTTARHRGSISDIAATLGVSPAEVSRAIDLLELHGYMTVTPVGDGTYQFTFPFLPEDGDDGTDGFPARPFLANNRPGAPPMHLTTEEAAARLGVDEDVLLGLRQKHREESLGSGAGPGSDDPVWTEEELERLKAWYEERSGPLNPGAEIPPS